MYLIFVSQVLGEEIEWFIWQKVENVLFMYSYKASYGASGNDIIYKSWWCNVTSEVNDL